MVYDPRQDPKYKDDKLFLSLINKESRFNPNAVSPTGARGYAQVLSSTANDPGFGIKPNPRALIDPEQNVAFGYDYLNKMKERYHGDEDAALVAYNGGPGKADEWIKSGKNDKVLSAETRDYYRTIQRAVGKDFSDKDVGYDDGKRQYNRLTPEPTRKSNTESSNALSTSTTTQPDSIDSDRRQVRIKQPKISGSNLHDAEKASTRSPKLRLDNYENTFRFRPQQMTSDLDNPLDR